MSLRFASSRADDTPTAGGEELDEENSHSAGGAENQRPLAGPNADGFDDPQGGGAVVEHGGGMLQFDPFGDGNGVVQVGRGEFGVSAGAARPRRYGPPPFGRPRKGRHPLRPHTTVPPTPLPGTYGGWIGKYSTPRPDRIMVSTKRTSLIDTAMSTWSGWGAGSATVLNCRASGPPKETTSMAFIAYTASFPPAIGNDISGFEAGMGGIDVERDDTSEDGSG